ncbi:MAG TPA: heat-inducible transcriptional repressor HrcA, partial [Chroococcales cyanobacterium]
AESGPNLDPRKRTILKAVVKDYVLTAEPVGSRTLARRYDFGLSPATIRNELADLEAEGFIRQPHHSAGRIPSDWGYRFYVDHLMDASTAPAPDSLEHTFSHDLQDLLLRTAKLTAVLAGCTAIVRAPRIGASRIKHLQLVSLGEQEAMLVMVTDRGVNNQFLRLPSSLSSEELMTLSNFLNASLKGQQINGLTRVALNRACEEMRAYQDFLGFLWGMIRENVAEKVYLSNTSFLAQQPEFEVGRISTLLDFLESDEMVAGLMDTLFVGHRVKVIIGSENPLPGLRDCSLVSASYSVGKDAVGEVGVIGPTRMDYPKAIHAIETVADLLSGVLNEFFGGDDEKEKR